MSRMLAVVVVAGSGFLATPAEADIFKVFAQVDGGGMMGTGTSGAQKDTAFFKNRDHPTTPHADYGASIGAELFFIDAWIQHHQFIDGQGLSTWTQFGLGMHFELDFAKQAPADTTSKPVKGVKEGGFAEIGVGLWFGLGTGQQVDPPLDSAQISDKALLAEARIGMGTHLNKVLDLGVQIPVSYGYFIKNGNGATANDLDTHYRGVQGEVILYLRGNIRLF